MKKLIYFFLIVLSPHSWGQENYLDSIDRIIHSLSGEQKIDAVINIPFDKLNSNIKASILLANETLKEAKAINDVERTAETERILSIIYYYDGDYDASTKSALSAIKNFESIKNYSKAGDLYAILGYQMKRRNITKAFNYMKTGIDYLEKDKNLPSLSAAYNNIGVLYEMSNDYDSALIFYNKGLEIVESLNDSIGLPYSYNNLSALYLLKNDFKKSEEYLDKSFEIRNRRNDLNGMAENYQFYGDLYAKQNKTDLALSNYQKAFEIGEKIEYPYICQRTQEELSKLYEKKGNFEAALYAQKKATYFKEQILNEQTNKTIAQLEIEFDTEKKEKELIQKDLNFQQAEQEVERKSFRLLILAIITVLIILIAAIIYRQQKYKNNELIEKNKLQKLIADEKLKNELNEERLRISRDLHDNIGSQLTFITSSVENIKYLNKDAKVTPRLSQISDFTKSTINQLRDTIWAMNKSAISMDDLHKRILNFVNQAQDFAPSIQFDFEVPPNNQDYLLNAEQGITVFRIIQEAVNNSIKYANASQIKTTLKTCENEICIQIKDNGIGFDSKNVLLGNGMNNMNERAQEIEANLLIHSELNKGTLVEIKLKINS